MKKYGFLILLVLSACAMVADQYDYKPHQPNEVPATMQFEDKPSERLSVHIRSVNGLYLFNYKTVSKEIQNNKIRLSPGLNKLTLWIKDKTDTTVEISLNVVSTETYGLHIKSDQFWLASVGEVWISDKKGNRVAGAKYNVTPRLVY